MRVGKARLVVKLQNGKVKLLFSTITKKNKIFLKGKLIIKKKEIYEKCVLFLQKS